MAQQFIQETDHTYTYQKLDRDFTREELFEQFPGARTFPQIILNGEKIGGLAALTEMLTNEV